MSLVGDPFTNLVLSFNNLLTTESSFPNLWDSRYQTLLNNDAILNRRIGSVENGTSPARRIRTVPDLAALRALTGLIANEDVIVEGYGLFRYASDNQAELSPYLIRPTLGTLTGTWKLEGIPKVMLEVPNGVATLDGSSRLKQALRNGAVSTEKILNNAVTNLKIASLTVADTAVTPDHDTDVLSRVVNMLAWQLRLIIGKGSWRATPSIDLETIKFNAAFTNVQNTFTQTQTFQGGTVGATAASPPPPPPPPGGGGGGAISAKIIVAFSGPTQVSVGTVLGTVSHINGLSGSVAVYQNGNFLGNNLVALQGTSLIVTQASPSNYEFCTLYVN